MRLDARALGLSLGITWGACVALATLWVAATGGGEGLWFLDRFYPGYSVSVLGALLGLVYGFIDGFLGGWVLAWLYDRFARKGGTESAPTG